ncbi:SGNH/GDSL hydrolase family protein [Novipirellula sp. SH528]|uniref:SGNH/GDSL hydrolase family protein n=1 Tax=Novipirellula sp. SH528 TaxID=3454466 RepID=UPI003F9FF285
MNIDKHIVLLGDSIFDNKIYVPNGNSVHEHLLASLSSPNTASLVAVDGAVVGSVLRQIERIPDGATHLVLSVGGNDALYLQSSVMGESSDSVHSSLGKMKAALQIFDREYEQVISRLRCFNMPLTICTIYDCVPGLDDASLAGLAIINDIITRTAFKNSLGLIDLRLLCNEPGDYSAISPIEPSHEGGAKIVTAITQAFSGGSASAQVFC